MPATGLKIVGPGTCLPRCSISSFQNSLKTSGHRGYEFLEFWCWNLFPFFPDIVFTCWRVSGRLWWIFRLDAQMFSTGERSGASFIKCCTETILNLILWSFLRYAYVWFIEWTYKQKSCVRIFQMWNRKCAYLVRNWMVSALCLVNDS